MFYALGNNDKKTRIKTEKILHDSLEVFKRQMRFVMKLNKTLNHVKEE